MWQNLFILICNFYSVVKGYRERTMTAELDESSFRHPINEYLPRPKRDIFSMGGMY